MTITLAQLITQSRQRADMESSSFITDTELTSYINASIAELHDLLVGAYDGEYFLNNISFTTTNGVSDYALPNGTLYAAAPSFYKLRGVDVALSGTDYSNIKPFNFNERNSSADSTWGTVNATNVRYRLVGNNLKLSPTPTGAYNCKLWYVPVATKLALTTDTLDDLNQYSEYVIVDAAIKCMQKQESDVTVLAMQKSAMTARIQAMAQNRDAGAGNAVTDIYADRYDGYNF